MYNVVDDDISPLFQTCRVQTSGPYNVYIKYIIHSGHLELVSLAEEVEGEQSLDLDDPSLLVVQGVVTHRVGHHHRQLKLFISRQLIISH